MVLYVVISPSLAFLDQALPLVHQFQLDYPEQSVHLFFPNPGTIHQLSSGWDAVTFVEKIADSWHFPIGRRIWISARSLQEVRKLARWLRWATAFMNRYEDWLPRKVEELINRLLVRSIRAFGASAQTGLAPHPGVKRLALIDITELAKPYFGGLSGILNGSNILSVSHGLAPYEGERLASVNSIDWLRNRDSSTLLVCAQTRFEAARYRANFNLTASEVEVTGVLRHHPNWIGVLSTTETVEASQEARDTILLISRPAQPSYLPAERKSSYLADLRTLAEEKGLRILVKRHPKEFAESVFESALGRDRKGSTWDYTETHIFKCHHKIVFAVSFNSGVSLDLLQFGVPTIQRLDLRGLPLWDIPSASRCQRGHPIIEYRKFDLVLGATSRTEFFSQANRLLKKRNAETSRLARNYQILYQYPPSSAESILARFSAGNEE